MKHLFKEWGFPILGGLSAVLTYAAWQDENRPIMVAALLVFTATLWEAITTRLARRDKK